VIYWAAGLLLLILILVSGKYCWCRKTVDLSWPRILMYHMVSNHLPKRQRFDQEKVKNRLRVEPAMFERQVRWLLAHGWHFLTLSELMAHPAPPRKTVVLTFDDGYRDNYLLAFPILRKYGVKATIFPVVNRFHQDWSINMRNDRPSAELNAQPMLSHEQVRELLDSGLIEIGSHTLNHAKLHQLDDAVQQREICESKRVLEQAYSIECTSFAYPFGYYDERTVQRVRDCGYHCAVTTDVGIAPLERQDPLLLKRVMISGNDNFAGFLLKVYKGKRKL